MACSKKLDKIDKIFICLLSIFVTFTCVFNTFVSASENEFTLIQPNRVLDLLTFNNKDGHLFRYSNVATNLYDVSNTKYLIINGDTKNISFCFIKEEPQVYTPIYEYTDVLKNEQIEIDLSEKDYKYMLIRDVYGGFSDFNVYVSNQSFNYVIETLTKDVGILNLWTYFEKTIPFLAVVLLFSLGVWFIKHNIIEHSKGRDF